MHPQIVRPLTATAAAPPCGKPDLEGKAREVVAQLKSWAAACPALSQVLLDCVEELSWLAKLKPSPAAAPAAGAPLKHGVKQIVTALHLWAELYPTFSQSLLACVEELESAAPRADGEAQRERRARDLVIEALSDGYQTSRAIADLTGLMPRRVRRALARLVQLKLVRVRGCGALKPEYGNRTRLYELTHTYA